MKKGHEELFMRERVIFSFKIYKICGLNERKESSTSFKWMLPAISRVIMGRWRKQRIVSSKSGYVNKWQNQLLTIFGQVSSKHID